jgi:hypothetical protein
VDNHMLFVLFKLSLLFGPILTGLVGATIICYVAIRDLDTVFDNFKNSYAISYYRDSGHSFVARWVLASVVSGYVLWPDKHVRNGMLDPQELTRLPTSIRRRMKWAIGLACVAGASLVVLVVGIQIFKLLAV